MHNCMGQKEGSEEKFVEKRWKKDKLQRWRED